MAATERHHRQLTHERLARRLAVELFSEIRVTSADDEQISLSGHKVLLAKPVQERLVRPLHPRVEEDDLTIRKRVSQKHRFAPVGK